MLLFALAPAVVTAAQVYGYLAQPCVDFAITAKLGKRSICINENLLRNVASIIVIPGISVNKIENLTFVSANNVIKCRAGIRTLF